MLALRCGNDSPKSVHIIIGFRQVFFVRHLAQRSSVDSHVAIRLCTLGWWIIEQTSTCETDAARKLAWCTRTAGVAYECCCTSMGQLAPLAGHAANSRAKSNTYYKQLLTRRLKWYKSSGNSGTASTSRRATGCRDRAIYEIKPYKEFGTTR